MKQSIIRSVCLLPLLCHAALAEEAALESNSQKASYALGVELMKSLSRDNLSLDQAALLQGINDVQAQRELRLSSSEVQAAKDWLFVERIKYRDAKGQQNLAAGKAFLETNAQQADIHTLAGGLQYRVLEEGDGEVHPQSNDGVTARYRLSNLSGQELLRSEPQNEAKPLLLKSLIKGWQDALPLMTEGSKWTLFLPPELAYGENGTPDGKIAPNETLVYELELLSIIPDAANNPELNSGVQKISKAAAE